VVTKTPAHTQIAQDAVVQPGGSCNALDVRLVTGATILGMVIGMPNRILAALFAGSVLAFVAGAAAVSRRF
jgi:hypothetical protein